MVLQGAGERWYSRVTRVTASVYGYSCQCELGWSSFAGCGGWDGGAENAAAEAKAGELGEVMMEHGIQKLAPEFTHRPGMSEKRH